jgi:hypothetical protein
MPLELGIWRIDGDLKRVNLSSLDQEGRLEDFLDKDISIASPDWMVIGRQVYTDYGTYIDLLAIDRDGNLIIIELKRDKTPRDIVAQLLDYASWVKDLKDEDIALIYNTYLKKYHSERSNESIDDAFRKRFNVTQLPESLNDAHEMVVVASSLDASTERIVTYLAEEHSVPINAVFFSVFRDADREYISRVWYIDPASTVVAKEDEEVGAQTWNGEFYVSFGQYEDQKWEDAVKYGFISASGGSWYSRTLHMLEEGKRVWVNVPGYGYVGVGEVAGPVVKVDKFTVKNNDGNEVPLSEVPLEAIDMFSKADDEEKAAYLVRVKWIKTVPLDQAIKERGFFGNQNTVCKPTSKKWEHTVERLKKRFVI